MFPIRPALLCRSGWRKRPACLRSMGWISICSLSTAVRAGFRALSDLVKAMAEAVHYYKNNKEQVIKIMQKYTRGQARGVLDKTYEAYSELFVEDTIPTVEGLKKTLQIQASWDSNAAKAKVVEDFVNVRFVHELKQDGFIDRLYNR